MRMPVRTTLDGTSRVRLRTERGSYMSDEQLLRRRIEDHKRLIDALRLTLRQIPARLALEELAALNMALRDATNMVRDELGLPPIDLHDRSVEFAAATPDNDESAAVCPFRRSKHDDRHRSF
jgi:hypothetical protein